MGKSIKIGRGERDIMKPLNKFIKAEEKRERTSARFYKNYGGDFTNDEWVNDDDCYGDLYRSEPWWSKYELDDDEISSDDFNIDDYLAHQNELKAIYFYEDINDRYGQQIFNNIKEFNEFCSEKGILMSNETANNLIYQFETHCCLNPSDYRHDELVLADDKTYGGLKWKVLEDEDLDEDEYDSRWPNDDDYIWGNEYGVGYAPSHRKHNSHKRNRL